MSELQQSEDNDYTEVFKEPLDSEFVEFSVGNPRVEHITGLVHLYKRNTVQYGSAGGPQAPTSSSAAQAAAIADTPDVSCTVCCLAIPADMSVAHFCTFIGAYLNEVRSIQVLRREGSKPSVCMVLLSFADQEKADNFYNDFNGLPFSSLEPDILCRLVFVRSVEVLSARGRPSLTAASTAAGTAAISMKSPAAAGAKAASASAAGSDNASRSNGKSSEAKAPAEVSGSSSSSSMDEAGTPAGKADESSSNAAAAGDKAIETAAATAAKAPAADAEQQALTSSRTASKDGSSPSTGSSHGEAQQQTYAAAAAAGVTGSCTPAAAAANAAAGSVAVAAAAAPCVLWLEPPPGTTEVPTCPVCLERLDEHISGIVSTVCNHRFHGECLKRWGDTSCPVCRYCMYSSNTSTSRCSTCGTNANLWICLICGHVGCGRYKQGHASDHWKESAHCYALELETQRVWDYAGDGYVHRLIQSKTDGKLVEVPSPAPACSHSSPRHHQHRHHRGSHASRRLDTNGIGCSRSAGSYGSSGDDGSCDSSSCPVCADEQQQVKDVIVSSKLDAITLEYNYLLTTQLDSQRQYFEGLLAQQEAKQQQALAAAVASAERAAQEKAAVAAAAKENERKRQQLERKLSELSASAAKASEEREFLRSLNETLLANQKEFGSKLKSAQAALTEKDAQLQDLQEQVRDLMVYIEAQRTIEASGSELQDATLLPVPAKESSSSSGRRRSSKK